MRSISRHNMLVLAMGRKLMGLLRAPFLNIGVIRDIFQESGTQLCEKKNSNNSVKGRTKQGPRVLKVFGENPSGCRSGSGTHLLEPAILTLK